MMNIIMSSLLRLMRFIGHLNALSKNTKDTLNLKYSCFNQGVSNFQLIVLNNQSKNYSISANDAANKNKIDKNWNITAEQKIIHSCIDILKLNQISSTDFNSFLNKIRKSGNIASLEGLFLLHCCRELTYSKSFNLKEDFIDDIWETLNKLDIPLYVAHYNCLLAIYIESDHKFCPINFLNQMLNNNIKPDITTLERVISQYCKKGKLKEANEIITFMKNEHITIHENPLCSILDGYLNTNDLEAANVVINKIVSYHIRITIQTYAVLMNNFAKNGDIEEIRKTLDMCKVKNVWIPDKVFLEIIYHLSLNGFIDYVDEILSKMPKTEINKKEANRIIYKLLENQQENIAFKIFKICLGNKFNEQNGIYFLNTLKNFNLTAKHTEKYLQFMKERGMDEKIFMSLRNDNNNNSNFVLNRMWRNLDHIIKEKYFYSIFNAFGQANQIKEIGKVLQKMVVEFHIQPSINMLVTYILPYIPHNSQDILSMLVNCEVNLENSSNAIVLLLLSQNKIREAKIFMNNNYAQYKIELLKSNLLQALKNTEDVPSFISILYYLYMSKINDQHSAKNIVKQKCTYQRFIDCCILEAVNLLSIKNSYVISTLFENLKEKGLSLSPKAVEKIEAVLMNQMTPVLQTNLAALKSGNLVPKVFYTNYKRQLKLLDIKKLENMSDVLSRTDFTKQLFNYYTLTKSENKVFELLKEFKKTGRKISMQEHLSMIGMYLNLYKLDKAELWIQKCIKKFPEFRLPHEYNLQLVTQYALTGDIKKVEACLESTTIFLRSLKKNSFTSSNLSKYKEDKIFDLLKSYDYTTTLTTNILKTIVNYYIHQNDLKAAVSFLEYVYKTYNLLLRELKLITKCVIKNDIKLLERVINLFKNNYTDSQIFFVIALAYLEIDKKDLTKYILETYCRDLSEKDIIFYAEKYYRLGKVHKLEKLMEVFDDLEYNVESLCLFLLKAYYIRKDWTKILFLRFKMIESNRKPSLKFMQYMNLAMICDNKNLKLLIDFQKAIEHNNYLEAKKLLHSLPILYKSDYYSILCWKLTYTSEFSEILDICRDLKESFDLELNPSTAEFVLKRMVQENHVEFIEIIEQYLSQEFKRQINYSYYLNLAYLKTGCWNLYLKKFNSKSDDGTLNSNDLNINSIIVVKTLLIHPELIGEFELLSCKYDKKYTPVVIIAIWIYYFLNENPQADKIWIDYNLKDSRNSTWLNVFYFLRSHKNLEIYFKCIQLIQESDIKRTTKLVFLSKLIQYCMDSDNPKKYEYGLKCLQDGMKDFDMVDFDIKLLANLQTKLEASGIPWPWTTAQIRQ